MLTDLFRTVADVVAWAASEAGTRVLDALAPLPDRQPVVLDENPWWVKEPVTPKGPRIVKDRGLGEAERDAEWVDRDGDRWRWHTALGMWQSKMQQPDMCSSWLSIPREDGRTSAVFAPYREATGCGWSLPETPSAVAESAPASGTTPAEVKCPAPSPEAPAPGTPTSTGDEERFRLLPGDGSGVAHDIAFCLEAGDLPQARHQLHRLIELLDPEDDAKPPRVNEDAAPVLREAAIWLRRFASGELGGDDQEVPYVRNVAHCLDIYADECDAAAPKHAQK